MKTKFFTFEEFVTEELGGGMGAVVTSTPSAIPGQTMGGNGVGPSFGEGGIVGSGDIGAGYINNRLNVVNTRKEKRKRKKRK
jgi:hypothetical protein